MNKPTPHPPSASFADDELPAWVDTLSQTHPGISQYTATELAEWLYERHEVESVFRVLDHSGTAVTDRSVEIIIRTIQDNMVDDDEDWPEDEGALNYPYWISESGFTAIAEPIMALACNAAERTPAHVMTQQMELADPWIRRFSELETPPQATTWERFLEVIELWESNIINRNYSPTTAELLGSPDGLVAKWESAVGPVTLDGYIIAPIVSQPEFATESVQHRPDLYARYANRCASNNAKPFLALEADVDEDEAPTATICIVRRINGKWALSYPTSMYRDKDMLRTLQYFARRYHQAANQNNGPRTPASRVHPQECADGGARHGDRRTPTTLPRIKPCARCSAKGDHEPQVGPDNSPATCRDCRDEYRVPSRQITAQPSYGRSHCYVCGVHSRTFGGRAKSSSARVCCICARISQDYQIFDRLTRQPIKLLTCKKCGTYLVTDMYGRTCDPCQADQ